MWCPTSQSTGVLVNGSTFRGNTALSVLKSDRTPLTVVNSTFSGNTGQAIYNAAVGSTVTNSTIANNATGIQSDSAFCSGCAANVTVTNTLLSSNGNINLRQTGTATLTSGGHNLIDDATAAAFTAADPTNIIIPAGTARIATAGQQRWPDPDPRSAGRLSGARCRRQCRRHKSAIQRRGAL